MSDLRIPLMEAPPNQLTLVWEENDDGEAVGLAHIATFYIYAWRFPNDDQPQMMVCGQSVKRDAHNPWAESANQGLDICPACIVTLMNGPYGRKWFFQRGYCDEMGGYHTSPHQEDCPFVTLARS